MSHIPSDPVEFKTNILVLQEQLEEMSVLHSQAIIHFCDVDEPYLMEMLVKKLGFFRWLDKKDEKTYWSYERVLKNVIIQIHFDCYV